MKILTNNLKISKAEIISLCINDWLIQSDLGELTILIGPFITSQIS